MIYLLSRIEKGDAAIVAAIINMSNSTETKEKKEKRTKTRNPGDPRNNVNVSLRKRDKTLLNDILSSWEQDGCNISSEVCDAILLKNLSNTNPHIQTILSTLSLIESSLKSHLLTKGLSEETISIKALEIFNEVITIDIDGNKLTNLIKGVGFNLTNEETIQKSKPVYTSANSVSSVAENKVNNPIVKEDKIEKVVEKEYKVYKEEKVEKVEKEEEIEKELNTVPNNDMKNAFVEKEEPASTEEDDINDFMAGFTIASGFQA